MYAAGLEVGAEANLAAAIQVAQLALKHRQNKRQQQRIIAFIGRYVGVRDNLYGTFLYESRLMMLA
jgi:hypothetical protein